MNSKLLLQLDPDRQSSSFDAIVAIDSGVDQLLPYHLVEPSEVRDIVHGALFTRPTDCLHNTAVFVGGSDVARAEALADQVVKTFFGPMRVSVMMDPNGANTTSAAAVLATSRHLPLAETTATVLAGTGPVGQRVALLLAREGCQVHVASRSRERAANVCDAITRDINENSDSDSTKAIVTGTVNPIVIDSLDDLQSALEGSQLVIAAGAAGVQLLPAGIQQSVKSLKVAIDLNAVPPHGIESVCVTDKATSREGVIGYGAIGVGGIKMKIHREAIRRLFTTNDLVLGPKEMFSIGQELS